MTDSTLAAATARLARVTERRALTDLALAKGLGLETGRDWLATRAERGSRAYRDLVTKAATPALATVTVGAGGLIAPSPAWGDFVRLETVLGRIGPQTRKVAPFVPITIASDDIDASFVGEGQGTPCIMPAGLTDTRLLPYKLAAISVVTREAVKASGDAAAVMLERSLARAIGRGEDKALLDGAAAVVGVRPASVLFGKTAITTGTLEGDVAALLAAVRGGAAVAPYFIATPAVLTALATARSVDGGRVFPSVTVTGGDVLGVPVVPTAGAQAGHLVLLDADALLVADQDVEIDTSGVSSIQMETDPTQSSVPPVASSMVSLLQTNSVAIKAVRFISWELAIADGVAFAVVS